MALPGRSGHADDRGARLISCHARTQAGGKNLRGTRAWLAEAAHRRNGERRHLDLIDAARGGTRDPLLSPPAPCVGGTLERPESPPLAGARQHHEKSRRAALRSGVDVANGQSSTMNTRRKQAGSALMLSLWALILLSAAVMAWAEWIEQDIVLTGNAN